MLRVSVCDNIHRKRALRHRGMTQISFAAFLSAASFGAALLTGCGLGTVRSLRPGYYAGPGRGAPGPRAWRPATGQWRKD